MRGKLCGLYSQTPRARLIPVGAGKTLFLQRPSHDGWAHPRWCGENQCGPSIPRMGKGSSPLVRGKPQTEAPAASKKRLIPVGAGKTLFLQRPSHDGWAHPRWCGENWNLTEKKDRGVGSSPLVRGKHFGKPFSCGNDGLIPAGAGKTLPASMHSAGTRAHPRWCGENRLWFARCSSRRGSSPLVRGKPVNAIANRSGIGLIPAGAGKTNRKRGFIRRQTAHPRWCGENQHTIDINSMELGSSPLVRGKHLLIEGRNAAAGLIPAGAGKTGRTRP